MFQAGKPVAGRDTTAESAPRKAGMVGRARNGLQTWPAALTGGAGLVNEAVARGQGLEGEPQHGAEAAAPGKGDSLWLVRGQRSVGLLQSWGSHTAPPCSVPGALRIMFTPALYFIF